MTYIFITLTLDEVKRSFQINHRKHIYFKGQMNQNFDLFLFSSILVKCV